MTHARSREQWQARVLDYESSGLTMRTWCERNGVRDGKLRYWLKKARDARQSQSWAGVEVLDEGVYEPSTGLEPKVTVRIGAAVIEVRAGFNQSLLSEVLRVVVAAC
jgi:transposase-like protein